MIRRQVQGFKVVVVVFHFRTVCHRKAHAEEDFPNLVFHDGQRVHAAHFLLFAGESNIQCFCLQLVCQHCLRQLLLLVCQCRFNICTHLIGKLSHCRTFLCGQLSHLLQDTGQFTFFSQILYTQGFQHLGIRTVRQCLFGSRTDRFQLFLHNIVPFFRRFCGHLALWQYRTKSPDALCAVLPYGKHISKKPCPVKTGQGSRLFKTTHFQRAVTLLSLMRTPHLHLL